MASEHKRNKKKSEENKYLFAWILSNSLKWILLLLFFFFSSVQQKEVNSVTYTKYVRLEYFADIFNNKCPINLVLYYFILFSSFSERILLTFCCVCVS